MGKLSITLAAFAGLIVATGAHAQGLTGEARDSFVHGGMPACISSAKQSFKSNQAYFDAAGISSDEHVSAFCECMLGKTADQVTPDEFAQLSKSIVPDSMKTKSQANGKACGPALLGKPVE